MEIKELLEKYDLPVPRYTSYPTVPYWTDSPSSEQWIDSLTNAFEKNSMKFALYIHLPFCETLCTYCGCNTVITSDHSREAKYVESVLSEWNQYINAIPNIELRECRQIHLGGGTPTFFSPENLRELLEPIVRSLKKDADFEASIEVDPRHCSAQHLETLFDLGFRRISLGVQDFNHEVQEIVNRIQPPEMTGSLTKRAREIGFTSVNFDLIYGLPKQTLENIEFTLKQTIDFLPDRIALYSLAKVPWIKKAHRLFKDEDLPDPSEKRALYERARRAFHEAGYVEIGMDHFTRTTDSLYRALETGDLHRNFMGYTEFRTEVLLGLGVSAISETPECFHQNEKILPRYQDIASSGRIPTFRGHLLSREDQAQREKILRLMTRFQVEIKESAERERLQSLLADLRSDGLVEWSDQTLVVTEKGRPFLRNACSALDKRMIRKKTENPTFSQSI